MANGLQNHAMRLLLVVAPLALVACASGRDVAADRYPAPSVMQEMVVEYGTVLEVRRVKIDGSRGQTGAGVGAALGATAGSSIGSGGRDALAGAIVGAVAGGLVGAAVEKSASQTDGIEIVYRLDNGQTRALVQGLEGSGDIRPGDRIRITRNAGGARAVRSSN
jgi:outer membrane lipoprotein SlyB